MKRFGYALQIKKIEIVLVFRSDDCIFNPIAGMRGDEEYNVQLSPMQV
jgi:hypothetical protein